MAAIEHMIEVFVRFSRYKSRYHKEDGVAKRQTPI